MSIHKECGVEIRWAHREDDPDRFMPPLELVGPVIIVDVDGIGRHTVGYQTHVCDPDLVEAWQDRMARLAEAKESGGAQMYRDNREQYRLEKLARQEQAWEVALEVDCATCLQPVGEKCISMARQHRKTGEMVEVSNPHPNRLTDGEIFLSEANQP